MRSICGELLGCGGSLDALEAQGIKNLKAAREEAQELIFELLDLTEAV